MLLTNLPTGAIAYVPADHGRRAVPRGERPDRRMLVDQRSVPGAVDHPAISSRR